MAKKNTTFFCKECGYETSGWMGKCPGCGQWNTFVDSVSVTGKKGSAAGGASVPSFSAADYSWTASESTVRLSEAGAEKHRRISSGIENLDGLLGGGITEGSVTLVGGEPGIGKSTLLLQLAASYKGEGTVLYVSGEESPAQIGMRAERLGIKNDNIIICAQTDFEKIAQTMSELKPSLCIADSIQTLYSNNIAGTPGSVSQTKEVTAGLIRMAKTNGVVIILVGHITKEGSIAGPKTLEHMVDTVLYFEGNEGGYRILRSVKNRFGKTGEIAFFEMTGHGLVPVDSNTALLCAGRPLSAPGSALSSAMEGTRAVAVEIQSLLSDTCYGTPQRMINGPDRNRTSMLLAVAQNTFSLPLGAKDCFINVIGGMRITDPACDLALIASVVSAARNIPLRRDTLILGEVGLTGELRPVAGAVSRISDALRLGIRTAVLPGSCKKELGKDSSLDGRCEIIFVDDLMQAMDVLFT